MRTASKFLSILVSVVVFVSALPIFGFNNCYNKRNVIIAVPKLSSTNLTREQARQVTNFVRGQVGKYGTVKTSNSSMGVDKVVTGLVSRADKVFIITLTVRDVKNGKTKQTTKNLKGSFEQFLNKKVKSAVSAIMR